MIRSSHNNSFNSYKSECPARLHSHCFANLEACPADAAQVTGFHPSSPILEQDKSLVKKAFVKHSSQITLLRNRSGD